MATIASLNVALGMGTAAFSSGAQRATSSLRGMVAAAAPAALALAGVASVGAGLGLGFKLAADAEQAEIAFSTMLGSADVAKQTLADLKTFAAATPFELPGLRGAAKTLLAFQIPADQLLPTLKALGDISAGTGKDLGELAAIFGKAKSGGRLQMDDINQLTNAGIPIISELSKQFGVAESEVRKLVETGKVQFAHLNNAVVDLTKEGGRFGGLMEDQSASLGGLFSTFKDAVGTSLEGIAKTLIETFNLKDVVARAIQGTEWLGSVIKTGMQNLVAFVGPPLTAIWNMVVTTFHAIVDFTAPLVLAWSGAVVAEFNAIWEMAKSAFGFVSEIVVSAFRSFTDFAGPAITSFRDLAVRAFIAVEFGWTHWSDIAALAGLKVALGVVTLGNQIEHVFTVVIPTLLDWLANNWRNILFTIFDFTSTIFINLGQNIRDVMSAIWDFIASGGTAGFNVNELWTPLTEGFQSAIRELPQIAEREMGVLEGALAADAAGLQASLRTGLKDFTDQRLAEIADQSAALKESLTGPGSAPSPTEGPAALEKIEADAAAGKGKAKKSDKVRAGALERGTAAAFSASFGQTKPLEKLAKQTLDETKKQNAMMAQLVKTKAAQAQVVSIPAA